MLGQMYILRIQLEILPHRLSPRYGCCICVLVAMVTGKVKSKASENRVAVQYHKYMSLLKYSPQIWIKKP